MSRQSGRIALVGLTLTLMTIAATARADDQQTLDRARELLNLLTGNKFDQVVAAGDDAVKAQLSAQRLSQIWAGVTAQLGAYQAEESSQLTRNGPNATIRFVLRFERGKQPALITLNDKGQMAGLFFTAPEMAVSYNWPDYVKPDSFREETVTVSAGQFPLPGTLTIPADKGPHPAVVLVHGSGPHDADETIGPSKPFRDLAGGLASRGVAVLRYAKRTQQHPLAKPAAEWTLDDEVTDDALAAVALLRKHQDIDPQRVYVLGHSLGGTLAPYIAQRDPKLAGIIILAGSARPALDLVQEQLEYLAQLKGEPSAESRPELDKLKKQTALIRAGKTQEVTEPILGVPAVYWERLDQLDPAGTAKKLRLPILVLQGGRDYQVTQKDFAVWRQQLTGRKNVTLKLFDNLNHLFMAGTGPSTPAEYERPGHVDAKVIDAIVEWIKP